MSNEDLIAEARDARHMGIAGYTTSELFDMVDRLADALEARQVDEAKLRDSIAADIWADEQECNKALRNAEVGSHTAYELGAKLAGLQRARDITQGVLVREARQVDGSTSDGYHTFDELYDYRMLYNAHAAHGWLAAGIPVVKSWKHSDGEPCFGGGWFIVTATLPAGQVSNHYEAKHWGLFRVPEVDLPPEYDGHTPADAAERLRVLVEARQVDEAALAEVIDRAEKSTRTGSKPGRQRVIARAVIEFLGERHEPEPVAGPAYIDIMPPSPESNRTYWTMYCRECGIEEMMTDSADDPRLVAWRDEHNTEVHAPVAPQPSESDATMFEARKAAVTDFPSAESHVQYVAGYLRGVRAAAHAETEWEGKEYRRVQPDGQPVTHATFEGIPTLDDGWIAEYRNFTPWLPVPGREGENDE